MKKRSSAIIIFLIFLFLFVLSYSFYFASRDIEYSDKYIVEKVIDGDTFVYKNETIRLICVDAPESNTKEGKLSKEFLESLILGKEIILERDIDDKDKYNRSLRYVYTNESGLIFVNNVMVQQGYATLFPYENNTKLCDEIKAN